MTAAPVRVRPAELRDAPGIADVHIQSWRETYSGVVPDRLIGSDAQDARRRMWESILSLDPHPGTIAVAERGGGQNGALSCQILSSMIDDSPSDTTGHLQPEDHDRVIER